MLGIAGMLALPNPVTNKVSLPQNPNILKSREKNVEIKKGFYRKISTIYIHNSHFTFYEG